MALADKIRLAVEDGTRDAVPVTVSIGVASGTVRDGVEEAIGQLLKEADSAPYLTNDGGRNRVELLVRP